MVSPGVAIFPFVYSKLQVRLCWCKLYILLGCWGTLNVYHDRRTAFPNGKAVCAYDNGSLEELPKTREK